MLDLRPSQRVFEDGGDLRTCEQTNYERDPDRRSGFDQNPPKVFEMFEESFDRATLKFVRVVALFGVLVLRTWLFDLGGHRGTGRRIDQAFFSGLRATGF